MALLLWTLYLPAKSEGISGGVSFSFTKVLQGGFFFNTVMHNYFAFFSLVLGLC